MYLGKGSSPFICTNKPVEVSTGFFGRKGRIMASYEENLQRLRTQLDEVDERLIRALNERMRLSGEIAALKEAEGKAVYDPDREAALLGGLSARENGAALRPIYTAILRESRRLQREYFLAGGNRKVSDDKRNGQPENPEILSDGSRSGLEGPDSASDGLLHSEASKMPLRAKYGLLGAHLTHSWSPRLHEMLGLADYELLEYASWADAEQALREGDFRGLNVTIPYKKDARKACARLSAAAEAIGAVNTLRKEPDGTLSGFNTDLDGFCYMLKQCSVPVAGRKALVLGSGGAGQMAAWALRQAGAEVVMVSRKAGAAETGVASDDKPAGTAVKMIPYNDISRHADAVLLVNATPVGMFPREGACPVDLDELPRLEAVLDLVYNPLKTRLILEAQKRGIPAINGLTMLVVQAMAAQETWKKNTPGEESGEDITQAPGEEGDAVFVPDAVTVEKTVTSLTQERLNIVLIGMPGSGKSTQGYQLARQLKRPFFDSDMVLQSLLGQAPGEYIRIHGEQAFREEESAVIRELGRMSGAVIATGGGAVLREENRRALQQNGFLIWLDRPMENLAVTDRPLSQEAKQLEAMVRERSPIYRALCDASVRVSADRKKTGRRILRALEKGARPYPRTAQASSQEKA